VAGFLVDQEHELLVLKRELEEHSYTPRPYRVFTVQDPKWRTISAPAFRDRVVHHALCDVLEPVFERVAVFDSYACRKGKGLHAAVRRAQAWSRRWPYFLGSPTESVGETVGLATWR